MSFEHRQCNAIARINIDHTGVKVKLQPRNPLMSGISLLKRRGVSTGDNRERNEDISGFNHRPSVRTDFA